MTSNEAGIVQQIHRYRDIINMEFQAMTTAMEG